MDYSIFISYRREDNSSAVSSFLQRLQDKFGKNVVFADNDSISPGELWPDKIRKALEQAKIVLVIIGNNWLCKEKDNPDKIRLCSEGDWVRKEVETAQELKKIIIPVLADISEMPDHEGLPESIRILRNSQFSRIKFQPGDEKVVEAFLDLLSIKLKELDSPDEIRSNLQNVLAKKYKIIKNVGIGDKTNVYLGRDTGIERDVIIKVLSNREFNDEFVEKLRIAAKINDNVPNCISILDSYVDRDPYHIITTFLKGGSLRRIMNDRKGRPLPYSHIKNILLDIANSLRQTHDINLTHCNVKPSNIILDDTFNAFLNHLSRVSGLEANSLINKLSNRSAFPDESIYREELCYLAPEIFDENPGHGLLNEGNMKIDQYMLGLVGYEMLTGLIPDTLTDIHDLEEKGDGAFKKLRQVTEIRTDCPNKFSKIIHRMIDRNPEKRYESLDIVIDEINQVTFDSFEIAKDSFSRCVSGNDSGDEFFRTFYNRLIKKLPKDVAAQLKGQGIGKTKSHKQYAMLREGIFILLQFGQYRLMDNEPNILSRIAEMHNKSNYNISPQLYTIFLDALTDTVCGLPPDFPEAFDKQCNISVNEREIIKSAWLDALNPGITYMKDKF